MQKQFEPLTEWGSLGPFKPLTVAHSHVCGSHHIILPLLPLKKNRSRISGNHQPSEQTNKDKSNDKDDSASDAELQRSSIDLALDAASQVRTNEDKLRFPMLG